MTDFLQEYKVELVALLAAGVGIFLLLEQMDIQPTIYAAVGRLRRTTPSDLTGIILILSALAMVVWCVRSRVRRLERWQGRSCPQYGGRLPRSHRRLGERMLKLGPPPQALSLLRL